MRDTIPFPTSFLRSAPGGSLAAWKEGKKERREGRSGSATGQWSCGHQSRKERSVFKKKKYNQMAKDLQTNQKERGARRAASTASSSSSSATKSKKEQAQAKSHLEN